LPFNVSGALEYPGEVVRSFVAVHINDAVRQALAEAQAALRKAGARVGWVAPENIHLTLAFLGDIPGERVPAIAGGLDEIAGRVHPFSFEVGGLGFFGGRRPKVIWAGVGEGGEALVQLQKDVATLLRRLEIPIEERPFHPHLTLGRARSSKGAEALTAAVNALRDARFGRVESKSVCLMRSVLRPRGPIYSVLHEAVLKA
jgi:2'-5' RNA ligase